MGINPKTEIIGNQIEEDFIMFFLVLNSDTFILDAILWTRKELITHQIIIIIAKPRVVKPNSSPMYLNVIDGLSIIAIERYSAVKFKHIRYDITNGKTPKYQNQLFNLFIINIWSVII